MNSLAVESCQKDSVSRRIIVVDRVRIRIQIFVQTRGGLWITLPRIHGPESADSLIVIPGPVIVDAERGIKLLAGKQVIVGRGSSRGYQIAEGVVIVGVSDSSCRVGQEAHRSVAVEAVEI